MAMPMIIAKAVIIAALLVVVACVAFVDWWY